MFRENISVWKSYEHSWDANHSFHSIFSWFRFNLLEAPVDTTGINSLWASLRWGFSLWSWETSAGNSPICEEASDLFPTTHCPEARGLGSHLCSWVTWLRSRAALRDRGGGGRTMQHNAGPQSPPRASENLSHSRAEIGGELQVIQASLEAFSKWQRSF